MGFFSDIVDSISGGSSAAKAATRGSETAALGTEAGSKIAAGSYGRAEDYLKGYDSTSREAKTRATQNLMGLYGIQGGKGNMQGFIDESMASPIYGAIMGTREAGEESILRNAAATGGLRSGNVQGAMYDYNQRLEERALLESFSNREAGLTRLMGLDTNENAIANMMVGQGTTRGGGIADAASLRGLGITAAGQAIQSGRAGLIDAAVTLTAAAI